MRASSALILFVAAIFMLPGGAVADQASQPTAPAAGFIGTGDFHTCAVLEGLDGAVRCWGYGANGQLGYGNSSDIGDDETPVTEEPVDFGPTRVARAVAAGSVHSCALLDDGTVRCWGFGADGRLGYASEQDVGDGESPGSAGPVNLGQGRTARAISAGNGHTCAVLDDGSVRCWGFNLDGRLGYGSTDRVGDDETPAAAGPVKLGEGRTAKAISAGGFHTCALLDDGTVRCWGFAGAGRLGYGNIADVGRTPETTPDTAGPVKLGEGRTAKAITAGRGHTCALLDNDTVRCWGSGASGRLGYGNSQNIGDNETPDSVGTVNLGEGRTARAISAGVDHTCALLDDNSVRCWGAGGFGQLGNGTGNSVGEDQEPGSVPPVDLGPRRTAKAISAGGAHTCALLDDDSVRCWGYAVAGRLGYCNQATIGDDESPASVGPVDLGVPGITGAACPGPPAPPDPGGNPTTPAQPRPRPPGPPRGVEGLAEQRARASALRACLKGVSRRGGRRVAGRVIQRRRNACRRLHGRRPGRVRRIAARSTGRRAIGLAFRAPGTDGSRAPAARSYVVKQSRRPIRTRRDFRRAHALCKGKCTFKVIKLGARITLRVTGLRRGRPYYYSIAARDNVSGRLGRRSKTVRVRPGKKPGRKRDSK